MRRWLSCVTSSLLVACCFMAQDACGIVPFYRIGRLTSSFSCSIHTDLLFTSLLMPPSICMKGASQIFEFGDLWQLGRWHLPNGVPFIHAAYSVFALDTFIPLFSKASLHCPSSNSSTPFSLVHSTTLSANIIWQAASFLMFSVSKSIMMANKKGLKADHWWRSTSMARGSLAIHQSGTPLPRMHHYSYSISILCRMLFPDH